MNRTFMEMVCSKMAHAGLPDRYYAEVVDAVAYIRYTSMSSIKGFKAPYEVAYSYIHDSHRQKLDKNAVKF